MRRSIRWRLQAWYALVLLVVVAGLAAVLYEEVRRGRYAKVDADLRTAADYLDVNLRRFPPHLLDTSLPPRPPPPGGPPPPSTERLLAEVRLPRREGLDDPLGDMYFFVYHPDGKLLKYDSARTGTFPSDVNFTAGAPLGLVTKDEFRQLAALGPESTRIVVGQPIGGLQR